MTWQSEMIPLLRHLINDLDSSNQSFDDERLEGTVIVAAQLLMNEIDFDDPPGNNYTLSIDALSISPDPTAGTKDDAFINLVSLKAACVIVGSEVRTNSLNAMVVRDGPSSLDMKAIAQNLNVLYKDLCSKLDTAIMQYKAGNSRVGQAVFSPYSPGSESIARPSDSTRQGYFGGY